MGLSGFGIFCLTLLCSGGALHDEEPGDGDITEDTPEGTEVTKDTLEGTEVTEDTPEGTEVTEDTPEGTEVTEDTLEGTEVTKDTPEGTEVTKNIPEGTANPTKATPGDSEEVTTGPSATTSPAGLGDVAVTPERNQTRISSGIPVRYWSPVLFVVLALLALFFAYRRKKGVRDGVTNGSDSSDLGALVQPPPHELIPKFQRERDDPTGADRRESSLGREDPEPDSPPGAS